MTRLEPIILNPEGALPGLIVVDHAGTDRPRGLVAPDFAAEWRGTHHFTDLGVAELARALAARLDMPVVLGTVSRLVLDVNRWLEDPRSILPQVEGRDLAGNVVDAAARLARQEAIFWPYHEAVGHLWRRQCVRHAAPLFFALHSCTRTFEGFRRPWDGGTIWHDDARLSQALLAALARDSTLTLGDNQPYTGRTGSYTLDRHCFGSALPACGFEVSNDLLETGADRLAWADRLAGALSAAMAP